eukprot:COSAG04_NODE_123_length_24709_cov_113.457294_13_plen_76_part_00
MPLPALDTAASARPRVPISRDNADMRSSNADSDDNASPYRAYHSDVPSNRPNQPSASYPCVSFRGISAFFFCKPY